MTPKHTHVDFQGQILNVGLDISRKNWRVCIVSDSLEHATFTQLPKSDILVKYLRRNFPGATYRCVYEAGYCGLWIAEELLQHGIDCLVVNPADVPTSTREKVFKSDRSDARKLARSLRSGDCDGIFLPSRDAQEDRSLVRTRAQLVKEQTRCKNRIKSLLAYYGILLPEDIADRYWSKRYLASLADVRMHRPSGDLALQTLLLELNSIRSLLNALTRHIRTLSHEPRYQARAQRLLSIPGISVLSAMTLLTELVEITRFPSLDQLASYVGLVPGEHSSGEQHITTGITHRRNPHLRSILIESAWVAARKDPALLFAFESLAKRMPKNRAIIRIARKLLNRIRYVLIHDQLYVTNVAA